MAWRSCYAHSRAACTPGSQGVRSRASGSCASGYGDQLFEDFIAATRITVAPRGVAESAYIEALPNQVQ